MKNIFITGLVLVLAVSFSSCKDFLNPTSDTETTPKTAEHLQRVLLGTGYGDGAVELSTLTRLMEDDVDGDPEVTALTGATAFTDLQFEQLRLLFKWVGEYDRVGASLTTKWNTYSDIYNQLAGPNLVLDYINDPLKKISGTAQEKNNVRAEAHTLRAFWYFHLVNLYAPPYSYGPDEPGVPMKLTAVVDGKPTGRSTVGQVHDQIVSDLLEAEKRFLLMTTDSQIRRNYHPNLSMVRLLLSRVYLYMEKWDEAAKYAELVIDNAAESGLALYNLNSITQMPYNSDTDREAKYYNFYTYENSEIIWLCHEISTTAVTFATKLKTSTKAINEPVIIASQGLMESFGTDDLRKDFYVAEIRFTDKNAATNILRKKVPYGKISISAAGEPNTSTAKFHLALRLSEAYLNYAEAIAHTPGGDTKAVTKLNELRRNRIKEGLPYEVPTEAAAGEALKEFIKAERRRELCFEGHRWFDLRRYTDRKPLVHTWVTPVPGKETIVEKFELPIIDPAWVLPLPLELFQKNVNPLLDPNPFVRDEERTVVPVPPAPPVLP